MALIDHGSVCPSGHTGEAGERRDGVARFQALEDPGFRNMPGFAKNGSRGRDPSQVSSRSAERNPVVSLVYFSPRLSSASESLSRILICRDKSQRTPNISIVARMARFPKVYLLEPWRRGR